MFEVVLAIMTEYLGQWMEMRLSASRNVENRTQMETKSVETRWRWNGNEKDNKQIDPIAFLYILAPISRNKRMSENEPIVTLYLLSRRNRDQTLILQLYLYFM